LLRDSAASKTAGELLSNNPYAIDFMGYDVFCRRGFSREFFDAQHSFAAKAERRPAAPTGTHKPTDATASSLLRDSAASKTGSKLLRNTRKP
jgi:hypothetical protein